MKLDLILKNINFVKILGKKNLKVKLFIDLNLENKKHENVMWINKLNLNHIEKISAGIIFCPVMSKIKMKKNLTIVMCENPRREFSRAHKIFNLKKDLNFLENKKKIPKDLKMGKNVVIHGDVKIGNNVTIGDNSVIKRGSVIGNNVNIGCSTTIGGSGFGYTKDEKNKYERIYHSGNVVIKDNVEIGNSTNIERATIGSTEIGKFCKIGSLVSIAHNSKIGNNCIIATFANIGGSVKIGNNVWVAPKSNLYQKIEVGNNSLIGMSSVVLKSVPSNSTVFGFPAKVISK
jgi:UDP-3-O-[3-hydroxymyristoyl] glucosamine N-acyltransferase